MAVVTKKIANLPASTSVASTDVFVKETSAGITQKIALGDFVIDNLISTATNKPLSAAQGKVLNDGKTGLSVNTKIAAGVSIAANGDTTIDLGGDVRTYTMIILGKNTFEHSNREGFDGRSNVYYFPKVIRNSNLYSPILPPDNSWLAYFTDNYTKLYVSNKTSSAITFRVDKVM